MYTAISKCRICDNSSLTPVIDLGVQMLTGVFPKRRDEAITAGPLHLVKCHSADDRACGLLQLLHSYDLKEMYGDNYGYRSGLNPSMVRHLHSRIDKVLTLARLAPGDLVIDIGSNDGTSLKAYPRHKYRLLGIDPTAAKFREFYPPGIDVLPDFFSAELVEQKCSGRRAKIITSFSMFYDLEDPLDFMREVYSVLDDDGVWVFEQSYMPTMLSTNSFDTICHEHLEYYGLKQIRWMADQVGFKIIEIETNAVNGGSFAVTMAKRHSHYRASQAVDGLLEQEHDLGLDTLAPYFAFAERAAAARAQFTEFLSRAQASGKSVLALGASTKGNVILQYCGVTSAQLPAIGEVNCDKLGSITPGTFIPIVAEDEVLRQRPDFLVILPWHFRDFFLSNPKFKGQTLVFPLPTLDVITVK
jgi:NDP-4-keto-2,6-dideoxyhexose 3-C-methyltransferase